MQRQTNTKDEIVAHAHYFVSGSRRWPNTVTLILYTKNRRELVVLL